MTRAAVSILLALLGLCAGLLIGSRHGLYVATQYAVMLRECESAMPTERNWVTQTRLVYADETE